jgi:hypothetical protein
MAHGLASQVRPLTSKEVADTLATFRGQQAVWWLAPASRLYDFAFAPGNREVDLVVGADGRELGRWRLNQASYGKLLNVLRKQPRGLFTLAHALDIYYDDFERLPAIKEAFDRSLTTLLRLIQSLEQGKYFLDDNPMVFLQEAEAWCVAADALYLIKSSFGGQFQVKRARISFEELMLWRNMQWASGAPKYAFHCAQLEEALQVIEEDIDALQRFFHQHPLPPVRPARMGGFQYTPGDGRRYVERAVFNLGAVANGPYAPLPHQVVLSRRLVNNFVDYRSFPYNT